ncbi:phosphoglycerate dehydrogenase [Pseudoflavonifractor capillosus]|uniref:phosphoglycerate dehydrogenase n=1 Tax=Pseudoflavonifractor capillosus TaxID=106588 RepID=UPI001956D360|nr:phosphoglycerate dehydrogenase [Pseudoflavonifractor capillosus]MBM6897832.1 phosphoglycerate dehydrogenase [Pseudoflavonifractor capillosus]
MFRIKTLNKIAQVGLGEFPADYQVGDNVEGEEGILVRSAKLHDYPFPDTLWGIARAGAGTNNIPVDACAQKGIVVFNTPGANANGVKELVIAALLMASRDLVGGVEWVKAQAAAPETDVAAAVEKGKSAFVGPELYRKTLGVVGLGAIGALVANVALSLGLEVYGYDPFLSVDTALRLDRHVHVVKDVSELYRVSDYITLHVPCTTDTQGSINADTIAQMKDGVRIVNLARGELVDDQAMIAALEQGKVAKYVTDFPNNTITLAPNVVPIPHLGASTPESEDNCAVMAAQQLRDFLENGNIKNSVNFPNVEMERSGVQRLCIIHRNIPAMLANITAQLSGDGVNVENMTNKSRGDYAYTLVDVGSPVEESVIDDIRGIDGIIRVRVIS